MFEHIHSVHLVGANGVGLSAVGKLLLSWGKIVSGSDLTGGIFSRELRVMGASIVENHAAENVPSDVDLLLYSAAVPETNSERQVAKERGVAQMSYGEFLGELSKHFKTIAVSGTNGKSTTTAMLGCILEDAGKDPTVVIGSRVPQWPLGNVRVGKSNILVVEACEYKGNFLPLEPVMTVVTNIEEDHMDYFRNLDHVVETFQALLDKTRGQVFVNVQDTASSRLTHRLLTAFGEKDIEGIVLQVPGTYNRMNAAAATVAALELGVTLDQCRQTLESFKGIWRRFERLGTWHGATVVSDYGHHPTSVAATLKATREFFPNRRIVLCFQPHQHSRTKELFDEFVASFRKADVLLLPDIYKVAGRTEKEEQEVSSAMLAEAVKREYPQTEVAASGSLEATRHVLADRVKEGDVLLMQGAGDIDDLARSL